MDPAVSSGTEVFLSPEVISSLITALAAALMGFFGWLAGKSNQAARKALREEQLKNLYEPLDFLISFCSYDSSDELLKDIIKLISKNYRYLTPDIQKEINRLLAKGQVYSHDFSKLRLMVSSTYNWLRKKLSYPYNKSAIRSYTSTYRTNARSFVHDIIPILLGIGSSIFTMLSLSSLLSNYSESATKVPAEMWSSSSPLAIVVIILIVIWMDFISDFDVLLSLYRKIKNVLKGKKK